MKNTRFLVVEERMGCHQSIFDEVNETEYFDIRILKEPNKSKIHPAVKAIVVVGTIEQAEHLREYCLNTVQQTNIRISELLSKDSTRYEIKYKINIVKADGNIFLSIHDAQSRQIAKGRAVIDTLNSFLNELNENKKEDKRLIDAIWKCLLIVNPDKKYTWAKSTGNNYRITYFDSDKAKRVQASVGNIMIVVGDSQTKIQDAPERKKRTDKKQPLFTLAVPLHGVISVYSVE